MTSRTRDFKRSNDPPFWLLFSAGGMLSALILPVLIVLLGFVLPAGEVSLERVVDVFENVFIRIIVVIVVSLAFWHAAHRIRFTLVHTGLHGFGAGGGHAAPPFDLDEAKPAGTERLQAVGGAELRHGNAGGGGRPHDGCARRYRYRHAVDGQRHRLRCRGGRCAVVGFE